MNQTAEIAKARNLGPYSEQVLNSIGVFTMKQLAETGSVNAYHLARAAGHKVSLNFVYAVEAAILGMDWRALPQPLKDQLKQAVNTPA